MAKGVMIGLALSILMWGAIGAGVYAVLKPSTDVKLASHAPSSG